MRFTSTYRSTLGGVSGLSRLAECEFAGFDTLGELSFCLLPECSLKWPDSLYKLEDQPEVILITKDNDITLEIENAELVDKSKRVWLIMPVCRGSLRAISKAGITKFLGTSHLPCGYS